MVKAPKKLIEVALPLDDINNASGREKTIRQGHPSSLHLWWARRPLAAARAVLFAQLVNDPGGERGWGNYPGQTKEDAQKERERLFGIIRELVKWENTNNEELLEIAREEIRKSWRETCEMNKGVEGFDPDKLPAFHDPFAGGGAIPLEAQRLGLESYATDLNPVAVMINKAMIEIPPKFAGRAPVGPLPDGEQITNRGDDGWPGATGLAEDIRRYSFWVRKKAEEKIGDLLHSVRITEEIVADRPDLKKYLGRELTVISWIWVRTVKSPNPAFSNVKVPLVSNFVLSTKKGKEAFVDVEIENGGYIFNVKNEKPIDLKKARQGTKSGRGANFFCIMSGTPIASDYVKSEGVAGRIGARLMAVAVEGDRERVYLSPTKEMEDIATKNVPSWKPETAIPLDRRAILPPAYGFEKFSDLFTSRQLIALSTFVELIKEARFRIIEDAAKRGWKDDKVSLEMGGDTATAYSDAITVLLTFILNKQADLGNCFCGWEPIAQCPRHLFGRQAIPMIWDFAESNPLGNSSGSWNVFSKGIYSSFLKAFSGIRNTSYGVAKQDDACSQSVSMGKVISTDPPYYDNIGYSDLSDFFYVWMRKSLGDVFPSIFSTISAPKSEELVAVPYRHGGKEKAESFFMKGMTSAIENFSNLSNQSLPITIYYAFKQSDTNEAGTTSSGWETFLEAVIQAGLSISGTWPIRTENSSRMRGQNSNALASSVVLVCRKREKDAPAIPRRQFLRELKDELPEALEAMIGGKEGASPIAPVDLAQAAIGPGMAVFSRYSGILEADGSKMSVHDALILINKAIDEYFSEAEGEMDSDTRFCIDWFQTYGFAQAEFGQADVLARAKGTTVDGLADAGVLESGGGKVRLFRFGEYPADWDPTKDDRLPVWEALHQLIRALREGGESEAGKLLSRMVERMESIRQLAYRLYTLCERRGWAEEARAYNELIASWHGTVSASEASRGTKVTQLTLDMSN